MQRLIQGSLLQAIPHCMMVINFTIRLTDLNNTPISNQRVNITIIDANGGKNPQAVTTDANGDGRLQLNGLTLGNYTVNVTYGGNNNYTVCNTTQRLQMTEKVTPQASTTSTSSSKNYDDGYWETSMDADFEYHTEYYSDGNFRQYDRSGRLVGSSSSESSRTSPVLFSASCCSSCPGRR